MRKKHERESLAQNAYLHLRVFKEELEVIKLAANNAGLSVSEYCRRRCIGDSPLRENPIPSVSVSEDSSLVSLPSPHPLPDSQEKKASNQPQTTSERLKERAIGPIRTLRGKRDKDKAKKTKGISRCSHGFMVLDGKTSCPQCA